MTKKEALEECRDLWRWVEEHPGLGKAGYFDKVRPELDYYLFNCPCCAYVGQIAGTHDVWECQKHCPLLSLWVGELREDEESPDFRYPCVRESSVYAGYEDLEPEDNEADLDEVVRIAGVIAEAAEEELRKLEAK